MYILLTLSSGLESFVQMLVAFIVFIIVIALTGITTKWIGGYQKTKFSNKNLKPIESMKVGNNKFIQLVKVGEVYLVVGIGKDEIHPIAKLTQEELPELLEEVEEASNISGESFQNILAKIRNKNK